MDRSENSEEICSSCNNPVTVGPVFSFGNNYICGNCDVQNWLQKNAGAYTKKYIKQKLKKVEKFFCPNWKLGCPKQLNLTERAQHIYHCEYTKMSCPFDFPKRLQSLTIYCSWTGFEEEFDAHFYKSHGDCVTKKPTFAIYERNIVLATVFKKRLFTIIVMYCGKQQYDVFILTSTRPNLFRYQLQVYSGDQKRHIILRSYNTTACRSYPRYLKEAAGRLHVNLDHYKTALNNPKDFIASVHVTFKTNRALREMPGNVYETAMKLDVGRCVSNQLPFHTALLTSLRCPICCEFMMPPISTCVNGDSFCSVCSESSKNICLQCGNLCQGGRNITLDKLTTHLDYPCHNRRLGCYFVDKLELVKKHEAECHFMNKMCFLGCFYHGDLPGLKEHVMLKHDASFFDVGKLHTLLIGERKEQMVRYICFTHDEIFRFMYDNNVDNQGTVKFVMCHIGFCTDAQYMYEVEINSKAGDGEKLKFDHLTTALDNDISNNFKDCIRIDIDTLETCMENMWLSYKLNLIRKNR